MSDRKALVKLLMERVCQAYGNNGNFEPFGANVDAHDCDSMDVLWKRGSKEDNRKSENSSSLHFVNFFGPFLWIARRMIFI